VVLKIPSLQHSRPAFGRINDLMCLAPPRQTSALKPGGHSCDETAHSGGWTCLRFLLKMAFSMLATHMRLTVCGIASWLFYSNICQKWLCTGTATEFVQAEVRTAQQVCLIYYTVYHHLRLKTVDIQLFLWMPAFMISSLCRLCAMIVILKLT